MADEPAKTTAPAATEEKPKEGTPPAAPTTEKVADKIFTKTEPEPKKEEPKSEPEVKKDEPKSEPEPKKDEPKKPDEIKYDLKLPKDSPLGEGATGRIAAYARERGLSNEQAQELLERENAAVVGHLEAQQTMVQTQLDSWVEAVKNDKELGGDSFAKNIELAKRFVDRFGTPEFRKDLNDTGFGNHPELVRTFVRAAKSMSEESLVIPTGREGVKRTAEELFYGDKGKTE